MNSFVVSERILARDPLEEIRRAFQLFDDDGTGKISLRNLRRVAKELGENLDEDELYVRVKHPSIPIRTFHFIFIHTTFYVLRLQASDDRRIRLGSGRRDQRTRVLRYHDGRCMKIR